MVRKAPRTLHFTKAAIDGLAVPAESREYHYDEKQPGLALCITPAGSRTFYVVRRVGTKVERVKLGKWPSTTIDQARDETARINGKAVDGINPNDKRRANRKAPTLGEMFDEFILLPTRTKVKRPKSAKTVWGYRQIFEAYLVDWKERKLGSITKHDIEKLHNQLGVENGHYTANRTLELIRVLFNTAIDQELITVNPAARLNKFEEIERERFLYADELPKFFKALDEEPSENIRDFIRVALFTGQRRSNCLSMRWEDIDLQRGEWSMPTTKTGAHKVPLTGEVLKVLNRRHAQRDGSDYVFPGRHGRGHLQDPMNRWRDILAKAGIKDLRIHDLRRSLGSWQVTTGASLSIVGKTLGHSRPETTAIYGRLELQPVRNSMESATAAILAAAKPKKKGRVKHAK